MSTTDHNDIRSRHPGLRPLLVLLTLTVLASAIFPAFASADLEQVANFAESGEGAHRLMGPTAYPILAVNSTGAGGVPAGTFYGIGSAAEVDRYGATGEFREAWGWGVGDGKKELERCGPDGQPAFPTCSHEGLAGEEAGQPGTPGGIAVDQSTGDVYVLYLNYGGAGKREHDNLVQVFSPDGSQLIASFGNFSTTGLEESPAAFHMEGLGNPMAVDSSGTVYLVDQAILNGEPYSRMMIWRPQSSGDYEHYVYAGRAEDIHLPAPMISLSIDASGNIYGEYGEAIYQVAPSERRVRCEYAVADNGVGGMTVDPADGRVFYWDYKTPTMIRSLSACDGQGNFAETGRFSISPPPSQQDDLHGLAFNPDYSWEGRPAGVLYAANGFDGLGYIFAPAFPEFPTVEAESVSAVSAGDATLEAQVNPRGTATHYAFQYLTQGEYEANRPDEEQSLTVSATAGVFSLTDQGHRYGGVVHADLTSGSATATSLTTATGTANLSAAKGTAKLKAAAGTGTVISGSQTITALTTKEGIFEANQLISGPGIAPGTRITAAKAGELTLSAPATASQANASITAGSPNLGSLTTTEGTFEAGQAVEGPGIAPGTTITSAEPTKLVISKPPTKPGTAVAIVAGSTSLTNLATAEGTFEVGQTLAGEGIQPGTTVAALEGTKLTLSKPATKPGNAVPLKATGPGPLAAGQAISGPGIAPGTTIESVQAGQITLSAPAEASGGAVALDSGLPFDASASRFRSALESLPAIGESNVTVGGGPGDETGSHPYLIQFTGALANTDVPQLEASAAGLSGGSATATVATKNQGGGGFQGATESPAGGADLPASQEPLAASAVAKGLAEGTAYRFRVIVSSHCDPEHEQETCEAAGPPRSFQTPTTGAFGLPDGRAWELVSPAEKQGGEVFPLEPDLGSGARCGGSEGGCKPGVNDGFFRVQSSLDGEAIAYWGFPFSLTEGGAVFNEYLARRTPGGWRTQILTPPALSSDGAYLAFDPSLSKAILTQGIPSLTPDAPSEYRNLYSQSTAEPTALSPLISSQPPDLGPIGSGGYFNPEFAGASEDLSRVFFAANDALTSATPYAPAATDPGPSDFDLYEWSAGGLRLVSVLPGNSADAPGAFAASRGQETDIPDAISADGSRVYWTSDAGRLYVREDAQRTLEVKDPGKFLAASQDGSLALLSDGCLYSLATESCTDLTAGKGGFQGLVGQSEDLSHIYFVDTAILTGAEENEYGDQAQPGGENLYAWHQGQTTYIGTLAKTDVSSGGDIALAPIVRTAEASPSGRYLAFRSAEPLTGYDNRGPTCSKTSDGEYVAGRCREAFLYDSMTSHLICASCNPSGAAPLGPTRLPAGFTAPGNFPQPRYLTDAGRLYFDSQDALSPSDTDRAVEGPNGVNGKPSGAGAAGAEDVYEWEPEGVGSCTRQGGCVSLLSGGREPYDSNFLAVDETGKNVFFTTRDQLVPEDHDDLMDVYDAREGGGFAPPSRTVECQGEACQPPVAAPHDPTPSSLSFHGQGNGTEPEGPTGCPKGKVRKHGKCVRKAHRKHHQRAPRPHGRAAADRRAHR